MLGNFLSKGRIELHPVANSAVAGLLALCLSASVHPASAGTTAASAYLGGPVVRLIVDSSDTGAKGARLDRTLSSDLLDCVGSGLAKLRDLAPGHPDMTLACIDRGRELGTIVVRGGLPVEATGVLEPVTRRLPDFGKSKPSAAR